MEMKELMRDSGNVNINVYVVKFMLSLTNIGIDMWLIYLCKDKRLDNQILEFKKCPHLHLQ